MATAIDSGEVTEAATLLSQDEMRQLLRECVTVVKAGETLILRVSGFNPMQVDEYQRYLDRWLDGHGRPFAALVLEGTGLGVAETVAGS